MTPIEGLLDPQRFSAQPLLYGVAGLFVCLFGDRVSLGSPGCPGVPLNGEGSP